MKKLLNIIQYFWSIRFIRFLFIGAINTLFGYFIFAFFIFLKLHYAIASFLATICGIIFNFKTTGYFVFNSKNNLLIFKFFVVYGILYVFNVICLYLLNKYITKNNYINGIILILPGAILSYILNKTFVFNTNTKKE